MCGFFGIVYRDVRRELGRVLYRAGERLSYRGYDTAGIGVIENGSIKLKKDAGKIEEVAKRLNFFEEKGVRGIIQLRWATFGFPRYENSQPHVDCNKNLLVAHNGNIINMHFLREELRQKGHRFLGENDGEVIVHLIEEELNGTGDIREAILKTAHRLRGDYAFVVTDRNKNRMYAVKKGSSLFGGKGDGFFCVSSDLIAILDHTRDIVNFNDGEMIEFTSEGYTILDIETGRELVRYPERVNITPQMVQKGGYPYFMIKEIEEIPEKARNLLNVLPRHEGVVKFFNEIKEKDRIFFVGAGSSYNASLFGAYLLSKVSDKLFIPSVASEFIERYGNTVKESDGVLLISQSGETKDVKNVLDFLEQRNMEVNSLVNVIGSTIATRSKNVIPIVSDLEISVPATKTFTNQLVFFIYLASKLTGNMGREIIKIPDLLSQTIEMVKNNPVKEEIVDYLLNYSDMFSLGYGLTYPISREGALKLKEVVYIHCEAMESGEFKHGPLSRVEKGYPVIFSVLPKDNHFTLSHINEVKCREGKIITISPSDRELSKVTDLHIEVPDAGEMITPLLEVVPFYLISYSMAVKKGLDPDHPRNISKTITVD